MKCTTADNDNDNVRGRGPSGVHPTLRTPGAPSVTVDDHGLQQSEALRYRQDCSRLLLAWDVLVSYGRNLADQDRTAVLEE